MAGFWASSRLRMSVVLGEPLHERHGHWLVAALWEGLHWPGGHSGPAS